MLRLQAVFEPTTRWQNDKGTPGNPSTHFAGFIFNLRPRCMVMESSLLGNVRRSLKGKMIFNWISLDQNFHCVQMLVAWKCPKQFFQNSGGDPILRPKKNYWRFLLWSDMLEASLGLTKKVIPELSRKVMPLLSEFHGNFLLKGTSDLPRSYMTKNFQPLCTVEASGSRVRKWHILLKSQGWFAVW